MKPHNALQEIQTDNHQSRTCLLAHFRSLLGSVRKRHRLAETRDASPGGTVVEQLPSPSLHDIHAGELEASMLAAGIDIVESRDAFRYDSPQELARARRVFVATLLVPLLLISALLIVSGNTLDRSLTSLLQFSTVALAVPLAGSGAAWLWRALARRHS